MRLRLWKRFGHKYFLQLLVTSVSLILIPCLVALFTVTFRSYHEMLASNRSYYMDVTQDYAARFLSLLNEARTAALELSVESRNSAKKAYALQTERMEQNAYYYLEATRALAAYDHAEHYTMLLYFPEQNALLSSYNKSTLQEYVSGEMSYLTETTRQKAFLNFLDEVEIGSIQCFSTLSDSPDGSLYIAVPIRIGNQKSRAVVLFQVEPNALDGFMFFSHNMSEMQVCIYSRNQTLLYFSGCGSADLRTMPISFGDADGIEPIYSDGIRYELFCHYDDSFSFYYALVLPYNQLTSNLDQFYNTLQLIMILVSVVLLFAVGVMLYINYAPVFRMVQKYGAENIHDEFQALEVSFEQITTENSDKNVTILDLLCRNMLYGVPIPAMQIAWLQLDAGYSSYCVMTLNPLKLDSRERALLTNELFTNLNVRTYITDLLPEDRSVIIAFLPSADSTSLQGLVRDWIAQCHPEPVTICTGEVVDSLNEIHRSFRSCIQTGTTVLSPHSCSDEDTTVQEAPSMTTLMQEILNYLQAHYGDSNLSRTMVADAFHVSVYSLSRLFKSQLDTGFNEYLVNCRLDHVAQLLRTTDQSITEIAEQCGFTRAGYLSKLFKETYGITPMQYRKKEPFYSHMRP